MEYDIPLCHSDRRSVTRPQVEELAFAGSMPPHPGMTRRMAGLSESSDNANQSDEDEDGDGGSDEEVFIVEEILGTRMRKVWLTNTN